MHAMPYAHMPRWEAPTQPSKIHVRALSDPRSVFVVDAQRAWHVPAPLSLDDTHVLCPYLDAFSPMVQREPSLWGRCPRGDTCTHVHADLRGATKYAPHLSVVARTAPDAYAWFPAGESLSVVPPGGDAAVDAFTVDSDRVLRTRAFDVVGGAVISDRAAPASVCSHFDAKQRCDRGARCKFAHVVAPTETLSVTPSAPTTRCVSRRDSLVESGDTFLMPTPDTAMSPVQRTPKLHAAADGTVSPLLTRSPSSCSSPAPGTPNASPIVMTQRGWRHNPYSA